MISAFIAAEVVAAYAVIRPSSFRRSWARAFCAFIIAVGFLVFGFTQVMHSPPYIWVYLWWLIGVAGILFVVFLFAASARLVHGVQSRKHTS